MVTKLMFVISRLAVAVLAAVVLALWAFVTSAHAGDDEVDSSYLAGAAWYAFECAYDMWREYDRVPPSHYACGAILEMALWEATDDDVRAVGLIALAYYEAGHEADPTLWSHWAERLIILTQRLHERAGELMVLEAEAMEREREERERELWWHFIKPGIGDLAPTGWALGLGCVFAYRGRRARKRELDRKHKKWDRDPMKGWQHFLKTDWMTYGGPKGMEFSRDRTDRLDAEQEVRDALRFRVEDEADAHHVVFEAVAYPAPWLDEDYFGDLFTVYEDKQMVPLERGITISEAREWAIDWGHEVCLNGGEVYLITRTLCGAPLAKELILHR